jgi:hypothetical protein
MYSFHRFMNVLELKDKIEQMNKSRHIELARILIHEYKIQYDENQNGIFINMSELTPLVIEKMTDFYRYIERQETDFLQIETEKNGLKDTYFNNE